MWEVLRNISTLMGIIGGCIAITRTAIVLSRRQRTTPKQHHLTPVQATSTTNSSMSSSKILYELDFWDKATVLGQGFSKGVFSFIDPFLMTFMLLFIALSVVMLSGIIVNHTHITYANIIQITLTNTIISGVAGMIVGLMVGMVSGVNEIKDCANRKRSDNNLKKSTLHSNYHPWSSDLAPMPNPWLSPPPMSAPRSLNSTQTKLSSAPLFKTNSASSSDWIYDAFRRQIENEINPYMGALIILATEGNYDAVVNVADQQMWEMSSGTFHSLFGSKQAYVKSHYVVSDCVYAATFKNLLANQGYVIWSDQKQPSLAIASPGEAIIIDWR